MSELPPHVKQTILELKALRGDLERATIEFNKIIKDANESRVRTRSRIDQISASIHLLEDEGRELPELTPLETIP